MNLLVCISKTPDTTSKIAFDSTGTKFLEEGIQYIMNPYDEWYALVRALELKEQFGGQVDVIHVGDSNSEMIIRKALAIGADKAFRVDCSPKNSIETAGEIAKFVQSNAYDIVLLGKETIDHNGSEVGGLLAGLLDWPYIAYANKLTVNSSVAEVQSEIEGGVEINSVQLPMVISCAKGMAEQRIPNMMGIMNAKKKPLEVIAASHIQSTLHIEQFELPEAKSSVQMISPDHIDQLIDVLSKELKII